MQKGSARRYILLILVSTVGGMAVWGALRFTAPRLPLFHQRAEITPFSNVSDAERWAQAIEQVKADRGEQANASGPGEVPAELPSVRHSSTPLLPSSQGNSAPVELTTPSAG